MHEVIRWQEKHATASLVRNGVNIDAAWVASRASLILADFETTFPNPAGELRPLRVGRALIGEQFGNCGYKRSSRTKSTSVMGER